MRKETKANYLIVLLFFLIGCTNSNDKTNSIREEKYKDYNFTILISVENSEKDFDYVINRKYFRVENDGKFKLHNEKLLEQVFYEYKTNKKSSNTDKVAVDTTKFLLDNKQLDKLYLLTSKLFCVDTLNITSDTIQQDVNYDGYHTEITLSRLNTTYRIRLNGLSGTYIVENYKNLLSNIESMKIESKHKSIESKKEKKH